MQRLTEREFRQIENMSRMFTKGGALSFFWRKLSPSANFHTKYICTNRDIMSASENLTKNTIWQINSLYLYWTWEGVSGPCRVQDEEQQAEGHQVCCTVDC